MKKTILIFICILLALSLCSCTLLSGFSGNATESSATTDTESEAFDSDDSDSQKESSSGQEIHVHEFASTEIAPVCTTDGYTEHICECGYKYIDTFVSASGSHSFERGVCAICNEIDYPELINIVSTETIKANVSVKTEYLHKSFSFAPSVVAGVSNGSGVIIKHTDTEYYVLTNNHVVYSSEMEASASSKNYYIIDYTGTEYKADCIANLAKYDLALMKFTSTEEYTVLSLESGNSVEGDFVISLGQPEGQTNTITLGNAVSYGKVKLRNTDVNDSNVTFDVLHHDAYINSGSSGGALLDEYLNVIGINYAVAKNEEGENLASYAIPVEKVYEFFTEVGFAYVEDTNENENVAESELGTQEQSQTQ